MSITTPTTGVPSGTWTSDPVHSTVGFSVRHMVVSTFRGRFERFDATLVSDRHGVTLEGTVDVASVEVRDPDLAAHLRAEDFFDVRRHPELRFSSDVVRVTAGRVEVEGRLTVKGLTRAVTGTGLLTEPHEDPWGTVRMGLQLEAAVDRRQYGLLWNMPLPKGGLALGNEVTLHVDLEFTRA